MLKIYMTENWEEVSLDTQLSLSKDGVEYEQITIGDHMELLKTLDVITVISIPEQLETYITGLAIKNDMDIMQMCNFLRTLDNMSSGAVINIILKEIALVLDTKYPDHIMNSKELFIISSVSGKIVKIEKNLIVNHNLFSLFRTVEDAQFAIKVMEKFFKPLFESGQK